MGENKIDVVAEALAKAWREGGVVAPLAEELWPTNLAEGYQVQDALARRLDYEISGWKLGMTSQAAMKGQGVDHPVHFGREYRNFTQASPARFRMSDFRNPPVLEGEFAFRMGQDLPPRKEPYSMDEVRDAVEALVMSIDMVDTRWGVHPSKLDIYQGLADSANSGAFVIGDELEGWQSLNLATLPVNVYLDGEHASGEPWEGEQRCTLEQLYAALHWAANSLSERGFGFKASEVVSTGSPHQPVFMEKGAEIVIRYGDVGEIRARVED
jgi:2-keto-4-pentenoate hydratase